MKLTFTIPDLQLEVTIDGGTSQFFNMMKLMEMVLHYFRTKEWIGKAEMTHK